MGARKVRETSLRINSLKTSKASHSEEMSLGSDFKGLGKFQLQPVSNKGGAENTWVAMTSGNTYAAQSL